MLQVLQYRELSKATSLRNGMSITKLEKDQECHFQDQNLLKMPSLGALIEPIRDYTKQHL